MTPEPLNSRLFINQLALAVGKGSMSTRWLLNFTLLYWSSYSVGKYVCHTLYHWVQRTQSDQSMSPALAAFHP